MNNIGKTFKLAAFTVDKAKYLPIPALPVSLARGAMNNIGNAFIEQNAAKLLDHPPLTVKMAVELGVAVGVSLIAISVFAGLTLSGPAGWSALALTKIAIVGAFVGLSAAASLSKVGSSHYRDLAFVALAISFPLQVGVGLVTIGVLVSIVLAKGIAVREL